VTVTVTVTVTVASRNTADRLHATVGLGRSPVSGSTATGPAATATVIVRRSLGDSRTAGDERRRRESLYGSPCCLSHCPPSGLVSTRTTPIALRRHRHSPRIHAPFVPHG
jgi:hypothetical protein